MSGTFPQSPGPDSLQISSLQPSRVSVTHSLKRQVRGSGAQRFSIKAGFPPLTRGEFAPINAFIQSQKGQFETFQYVPPVEGSTRGNCTSVVTVNGAHTAGSVSVAISGADAQLELGDYIKFANHSKVYLVVTAGQGSIDVHPPLQADLADTEVVTYNNVPFTVALSKDVFKYGIRPAMLYGFDIEMVEIY